uniref:Endothelin-1 n=1 Tax=Myripristis murdjan TaxID=586833 RepID=A0A667ZRX8_9TELE
MDLHFLLSMLSVMYSGILHTVLSAPAGETPAAPAATPGRHVRTKRCSCATFLDKECVYFCHLDIIWVNTPERVVSYGLGNAPRMRRAVADSMATDSGLRCKCLRENDQTCTSFCHLLRLSSNPSFSCSPSHTLFSLCFHHMCKQALLLKCPLMFRNHGLNN